MGQILQRRRQRSGVKGSSTRAAFAGEYSAVKVKAGSPQIGGHFVPPARIFSIAITSPSISRDASILKNLSPHSFLQSQHLTRPPAIFIGRKTRRAALAIRAFMLDELALELRLHEVFRAALESRPIFFGVIAAPLFHSRDERANFLNTPRGRVWR